MMSNRKNNHHSIETRLKIVRAASSQVAYKNRELKKKLKEKEMKIEILKKFQAFLKGIE